MLIIIVFQQGGSSSQDIPAAHKPQSCYSNNFLFGWFIKSMRLIHTADWHLGQSLHGFERSYEQQCFLDWLLDSLVEQQADALLIAGDVFDTANPPA